MLIMQGALDDNVLPGGAGEVRRDLQGRRRRRASYELFEGCEHEWVAKPGPQTDRAREMVKAFIAEQLQSRTIPDIKGSRLQSRVRSRYSPPNPGFLTRTSVVTAAEKPACEFFHPGHPARRYTAGAYDRPSRQPEPPLVRHRRDHAAVAVRPRRARRPRRMALHVSPTRRSSRSTPTRLRPATSSASASTPATRCAATKSARWPRARGATVVFGGIHATLYPEEALSLGGAHAVVKGDGDVAWPIVLADAARGTLQPIYEAGRVDADQFVPARWDLLPEGRYMWGSVQTVRGCPKHCSFCSVWRTDGQKPRQRARRRRRRRDRRAPPPRLPVHRAGRRQLLSR